MATIIATRWSRRCSPIRKTLIDLIQIAIDCRAVPWTQDKPVRLPGLLGQGKILLPCFP
ncbi:hypothetical protein THTE_1301 [Thermogutta terrifontis]|uniref:Uncharacterized protein n=1 Tax=Thermogutta terrifontis TaxID=1331910 RepID=A0A286RD80_9BACT|nr:hypothetical protein THTE_1301 [Thermogutta terrifontis]